MKTLREFLGSDIREFFRHKDVRKYISGDVTTVVNSAVSNAIGGGVTAKEEMDVFLIAGQSNARGMAQGTGPGPVPQANTIYQYFSSALSAVTGEVGSPTGGSAWPSFGITWNRITGRKICFVPTAVNATSQLAAADSGSGNWSTTGTLYSNSVTKTQEAITAVTNAGYVPVFRGVLWSQGENDANSINAATVTQAQYITEFQTMIANYRATFGSRMPFYIFKIGTRTDVSDAGYASIRQAQEIVAQADSIDTKIVFRDAYEFNTRGLMVDIVHYTQTGYNLMGEGGAANILNDAVFNSKMISVSSVSELGNINSNSTRLAYVYGIGLFKYYENGTANNVTIFNAANNIGTWQLQAVAAFYTNSTKQMDMDNNGKLIFYGSSTGTKIYQQDLNIAGANHFIDLKCTSNSSNAAMGLAFRNDVGGFTQFYKASSANGNFSHTAGTLLRDSSGGITFCNDGGGNFAFQKTAGSTTGTNTYISFTPAAVLFKESPIVIGNSSVNSTAMLQIDSTTKGFLPPRMTTAQRTAIATPAEGLTVYDTDLHKMYTYDGTIWQAHW